MLVCQVFRHIWALLKDDGLLMINFTSLEQLRGMWYYELCPEGKVRYLAKMLPAHSLSDMLVEIGFKIVEKHIPFDEIYQGTDYFKGSGPFEKKWRDADSFWSQLSACELDEALKKLKSIQKEGNIAKFIERFDGSKELGQSSILIARKIARPKD